MKYVIMQRVAIGPTFSCCINEPRLKVCVCQDKRSQQMDCFIFVVQCEGTVKKAQHSSYTFVARGLMNGNFVQRMASSASACTLRGSSCRLVSLLRALNVDLLRDLCVAAFQDGCLVTLYDEGWM
jgi:hypothetical protein